MAPNLHLNRSSAWMNANILPRSPHTLAHSKERAYFTNKIFVSFYSYVYLSLLLVQVLEADKAQ